MSRRLNLLSLFGASGLFLFFLYANNAFSTQSNTSSSSSQDYYKSHRDHNYRIHKPIHHPIDSEQRNRLGGGSADDPSSKPTVLWTLEDILVKQREKILEEMLYFEYPSGRFNVEAEKLSDLTIETRGSPYRSIIITTWRSGSTFLGDILNSMPGNYYHYEPLLYFDIKQIRGPPYDNNDRDAIRSLKNLLKCTYTNMTAYLNYGHTHNYLFSHNARLWNQCKTFPHYCYEPRFLEPFCKLFPLQSMKVVRLRLALAEQLLADESLNVRLIHLVRDPRGTLQSRKHREWCPGQPDCDDPEILCRDLVADYHSAIDLVKKYPQRLKILRYEDLSLSPYDMTQEILQFYGLPFDPAVEQFLDSHTKQNMGDVSSTFRDSKSAPFHWMRDLSYDEVLTIQSGCGEAMKLWGYRVANNPQLLGNNSVFNPLLSFPFS